MSAQIVKIPFLKRRHSSRRLVYVKKKGDLNLEKADDAKSTFPIKLAGTDQRKKWANGPCGE